jgi:DNA-binding transcriptional ArsR family regulator
MVKYKSEEIFAALGNPVRRQMAERLAHSSRLSLSDLAQPFAISLPAAMKHVGILEESGLVVCKKEGRVRYCAINAEALANGMEWFLSMEQFWEQSLDRLEAHLKSKNTK